MQPHMSATHRPGEALRFLNNTYDKLNIFKKKILTTYRFKSIQTSQYAKKPVDFLTTFCLALYCWFSNRSCVSPYSVFDILFGDSGWYLLLDSSQNSSKVEHDKYDIGECICHGWMDGWCFFYLSPLCSGVRPPLPQVGHFLIPNPWQSKHLNHIP